MALAWILYFTLHSLAASLGAKRFVARRWPALLPAYRLAFNVVAVVTLLLPLWLTRRWEGPLLWSWSGPWAWLADGLALAAAALFLWSLRWYDGADFLGLRQWAAGTRSVADLEAFKISPLHRHVRHPWYSLGLVILWSRDMNAAWLLTAVLVTLYLVVGSRLEERKLVAFHGEAYRLYREKVPGLVPLPGRRLPPAEADRLLAMAAGNRPAARE